MKIPIPNSRWVFLLLIVFATLILVGCASTDSENLSERPWNSPKTWENGMPSSINEGR